jgi:multiple sugar transport system substrate-binding protein
MITLKGMTWNHSRGFSSVVAASQRYEERHPDVRVVWEKRSLREFGEVPVEAFAADYDLMVIDHPFVQRAAATGSLLPFDEVHGESRYVGACLESYQVNGHAWALPIDAACPVAAYRPDGLGTPPATWAELLELAHSGRALVPLYHTDVVLLWLAIVRHLAGGGGIRSSRVTPAALEDAAREAMEHVFELADALPARCLQMNPIATYEEIAAGAGNPVYTGFAFGYSNYARERYARHRLRFGEPPAWAEGDPLDTVLGGTGIAVSALREHSSTARACAQFVASAEAQCGVFLDAGGQPAHREAWRDERCNRSAGGFFGHTYSAIERAFIRSTRPEFPELQEKIGRLLNSAIGEEIPYTVAVSRIMALVGEAGDTMWS